MLRVGPERIRTMWRDVRWQSNYVQLYMRALLHRLCLPRVTFVGITGSAGKTTAKDLTALVLEAAGPCQRTLRSNNRPTGVAETILATTRRHRYCVAEVSASRPGFLDRPVRLLRPDIAVLTMVARDHYSAFRSVEAIAAEKGKLVAAVPRHGAAVLNIDDPLVRAIGERCACRVIWIGQGEEATLRLRSVRSAYPEPLTLEVEYGGEVFEVYTGLHGKHLALPVLAALGVGIAAGVPLDAAVAALAAARPAEGRMEIVRSSDGVTFLRDDWKAPHWSLGLPLAFLGEARAARKVAVIGTIADSPSSPARRYARAAREALQVADVVVFVGPDALHALRAGDLTESQSLNAFTDLRAAAHFLRTELRAGDLVLLKGSNRADHLGRLVLDREGLVQCWRDRCGMLTFCGHCPQLSIPGGPSQVDASGSASGTVTVLEDAPPVLVGLGNPGERHRGTPHNAGRRLLEELAQASHSEWQAQSEGLVTRVIIEQTPVTLFLPGVPMNQSGTALRAFLQRTGADLRRCLLVHDDIDIPLGDVRLKRNGGDAGHRGVRSVIGALGTDAVTRVRIGVRPPGDERSGRALVLARLSAEQEALLVRSIERGMALLRTEVRGLAGRPAAAAAASMGE